MKDFTIKMAVAVLILATVRLPLLAEENYTNSLGIDFVLVEGGTFTMGTTMENLQQIYGKDGDYFPECWIVDYMDYRDSRGLEVEQAWSQWYPWFAEHFTEQTVQLDSFFMSTKLLSRRQYQEWRTVSAIDLDNLVSPESPESLNSFYAVLFCNDLSIKEGLDPVYSLYGESSSEAIFNLVIDKPDEEDHFLNLQMNKTANGYRLPTEAEWEYAARGGKKSQGYTFPGSNDPQEIAWFGHEYHFYDTNESLKIPFASGTKMPNELGLYDMAGNEYQWSWAYIESSQSLAPSAPQVQEKRLYRVWRGGNRFEGIDALYPFFRCIVSADLGYLEAGLRLVRSAPNTN